MAPKSEDPVCVVADKLREKKGLPTGHAKLETVGGDGTYQDFFRGKDLARYLREHPDSFNNVLKDKAGRTAEESAAELVRLMLSRGLIARTERKYKRPKPGRTRLVKWPRTLLFVKDQIWDEGSFYAWMYDQPKSILYYLGIALIPLVVIAACLFPLAPWWARTALVYTLMAVLVALLSLICVRYVLFTLVWVVSGHALWLFPNMMSDQVSIVDAFKPPITFTKAKSWASGWQARLATAVVSATVLWVLASHTPDMAHLKEGARTAHDSLFEYLDQLYGKNQSYLGAGTEAGPAAGVPPPGGQQFRGGAQGGPGHAGRRTI